MYLLPPPLNISQKAFAWRTLIHHTSRELECQILYASLASWSFIVFEMLAQRSFKLVLHDCMCLSLAAYFIICKAPMKHQKGTSQHSSPCWSCFFPFPSFACSLCRLFWKQGERAYAAWQDRIRKEFIEFLRLLNLFIKERTWRTCLAPPVWVTDSSTNVDRSSPSPKHARPIPGTSNTGAGPQVGRKMRPTYASKSTYLTILTSCCQDNAALNGM